MRRTFPDKNVVGKSKLNRSLLETGDWLAAKEGADFAAAKRVVNDLWDDKKTEQLKTYFKRPKNTVFISIPSTSRENVIPICLAQKLGKDFKSSYLIGDQHFKALHEQQSKAMSQGKRLFDRRIYEPYDKDEFKKQVSGKDVIVVDDILTTGGSAAQFIRSLEEASAAVKSVACLMGDRRLNIDQKTAQRLKEALESKKIEVSKKHLSKLLTRTEAGNMIRLINSVRTENAREKLAEKIQGLLNQGAFKDLGRDQKPAWDQGAKGKNSGDERVSERVSPWPVRQNPRGVSSLFEISVLDKTSGLNYSHQVDTGEKPIGKEELKGFLSDEAKQFVQRLGLGQNQKNLEVKIKPAQVRELNIVKERGLKGFSR
jgi:hypoxanthine phosphoribosyltransferase